MASFTFNIAKGRVAEIHERVDDQDPSGCELVVIALNVTGDQDAAMKDADTVAALLGLSNVAEVTNTGYSRVDLTDSDLGAITTDDTNDENECAIPEVDFGAISAGDAWTDIVIAYDPTGSSADAALVPLTLSDFAKTPDGSSIKIAAGNYFVAADGE